MQGAEPLMPCTGHSREDSVSWCGGFFKPTSEVWREAGIPCAVLEGEFKQRQVGDWSCYFYCGFGCHF